MEEPTEFQDWELLHNSDTGGLSVSSPVSGVASRDFEGIEGDADGAIKSDYFALDSESRYARTPNSDDESLADSENPSWVDPNSDSRFLGQPKGQLGFAGIEFSRRDFGGFWTSDESSDGQKSPSDHEKEELGAGESLKSGLGFGEHVIKEAAFGGVGGTGVVEAERDDNSSEAGSCAALEKVGSENLGESSTGDSKMENLSLGEGERKGMVWWKLPLELLNYCAFRVRPVWSVSVAAALVGIFMLGRRFYSMKRRTRRIPLKISIEDNKVSQFMARAARLNEAFQVVKRVPVIRPGLSTTGSTAWPVMALW